jgi:RES domain-containing protein
LRRLKRASHRRLSPGTEFDGVVWRHVPRGAHPLHIGYILLASGRWNRAGEYGCLYTSLTRAGAIAEYYKELAKVSGISAEEDHPRDLVSIHVVAKRVLDLTNAAVRKRMGVSLETITGDRVPDIDACRAIADLARLQGYRGILSPSAAADGMKNLNLYIDGRADDVSLMEGVGRAALNYR